MFEVRVGGVGLVGALADFLSGVTRNGSEEVGDLRSQLDSTAEDLLPLPPTDRERDGSVDDERHAAALVSMRTPSPNSAARTMSPLLGVVREMRYAWTPSPVVTVCTRRRAR